MTDNFEEFAKTAAAVPVAPSLVFDAAPEAPNLPVEEPAKQEVLDDSMLTEEEKKMVDSFAAQIDLHNSGAILQYGVGTQKKMADFSEKALENVRTKDMGEVGDMIAGLVTELKSFDAQEESKGLFGLFKKGENKLNAMKAKYNKVEGNVNDIVKVLEGHQIQLLKDVEVLDRMYAMNLAYFKELSMYILAGKKKLEEVRSTQLAELMSKAQVSGLPEDAQAAKDLDSMCNRFEKKLYDLDLTRTVSLQMAPQIRLVQNNNTLMVEKIQTTLINTIPLWKSQMVLALGMANSKAAVEAQQAVSDTTNELLRKNAEVLKQTTIDVARESERGVVDIETLQDTNRKLIETINEVMNIQTEGRQKRKEAEAELLKIEQDLKAKLLEVRP